MNMEFLVETGGKMYEISELVKSVSWEDKFNDGCGKLTFDYLAADLNIDNGSVVQFKYDDADIFYGYVFKHQHKKDKIVSVTAYDQLRYCKSKDVIVCNNDTVATLAKKMCNYLNLNIGTLSNTEYTLETSIQADKTWLDIVYSSIQDTLRFGGKWFILRDEFGSICLRDISILQTDLILGDGSYCYDFDYSKSIDDNFYNQIKLAVPNKNTGKCDFYMVKDSKSISKYGLMQYFEKLEENTAAAQSKAKADALLSLYNGETESLSMDCLGDTRIRAGSSFYTYISEIGMNKRLIVKSATHKFLPFHTMSLEVIM